MARVEVGRAFWAHSRTYSLAEELKIEVVHAGGLVIALWCWATDNATTDFVRRIGILDRCSPRTIALNCGWLGDPEALFAALLTAGFLERRDGELLIMGWLDREFRLLRHQLFTDEGQSIRRLARRDLRALVIARDGGACRHCGADENLTIDHIRPISAGGGNELDNLQVLCRPCNSRKGAR